MDLIDNNYIVRNNLSFLAYEYFMSLISFRLSLERRVSYLIKRLVIKIPLASYWIAVF